MKAPGRPRRARLLPRLCVCGLAVFAATCLLHGFYTVTAIQEFPEDIFTPKQRRQGANLQLSEDVAGATFMAAGSSAPELFTSLIGVFITKGDLGVGTIVGSAVFNILVIIGICGIFSGQVIYDEKVQWWEAIILISMYGIYILIMK
ncbi:hypothetical protein CRUP_020135 [Coryphaenoides rupestris]|nr:hypothetical protein CRUP_020135 [Coryphaenoides rupestris]